MKGSHIQICVGFALVGIAVGCSSSSGGDSSPAPAPGQAGPAAGRKPKGGGAGITSTDGATIYAKTCASCHGDKGIGGKRPPKLAGRKLAITDIETVVMNGKGRMPAVGRRLSKEQVESVSKYVSEL